MTDEAGRGTMDIWTFFWGFLTGWLAAIALSLWLLWG